ncbi:MAG: RNase A-like domain-containing protein [Vicinamibacterales bacterium]
MSPTPIVDSSRPQAANDTRSGGRNLSDDERRGGHTLARHVGRTDDDLRARLSRERQISAASTYTDRETAERVVGDTLGREARRLDSWRRRGGPRANLALDYHGARDEIIGRSLRRGAGASVPCSDAIVVLRWDERAQDFYVLTSYPEVRR